MLDISFLGMVQYSKLNIALIGKSILIAAHQRAGAVGWKPGQSGRGESASGSEPLLSYK